MSAAFGKVAFASRNKVLVSGVCRTGMRGVPQCVLQKEVDKKDDVVSVRGTVKAAVLEGDPACPEMVAVSVYDNKPVHFISMACDSIKWVEKT